MFCRENFSFTTKNSTRMSGMDGEGFYKNLQQNANTLGENIAVKYENTVNGIKRDVNQAVNTVVESVTTGDFVYQGWAAAIQATINIRKSISTTLGRWAMLSKFLSFSMILLFVMTICVAGTSGAFGGYGSVLWAVPWFWLACGALYVNWNVGEMGYGKYNVMSRVLNGLLFAGFLIAGSIEVVYIVKFSIDASIAPAVRNGTFAGLAVNATLNGTVSYLPGIWSPAVLLDPEFWKWITLDAIQCLALLLTVSLGFTSFAIFSWSPAWNSTIKRELLYTERMNIANGFQPLPGKSVAEWVESLRDSDTAFTAEHAEFVKHINWHSKHDRHTTHASKKTDAL